MGHVVINVWKQSLALVFVDPTTSKPALFQTVDPTLDPIVDSISKFKQVSSL